MIFRKFPAILILILTLACIEQWSSSYAIGQARKFEGRWIVLKNGGVIEGLVERKTDDYAVHTPQGSRIVIPFSKVDFVAESLSQAYWKRLAAIPPADLPQHESLFHWCLNHRLWEESKNQVEVLKAIGLEDSRVALLTVKIGNAMIDLESSSKRSDAFVGKEQQKDNRKEEDRQPEKGTGLALQPVDIFENIEPVFQALPSIIDGQDRLPGQLAASPETSDDIFASRFDNNQPKGSTEIDLSAGKVVQVGFDEEPEEQDRTRAGFAVNRDASEKKSNPLWVPPVAKKLAEPHRLNQTTIQTDARKLPAVSSPHPDANLQTIGDIPSLKEGEKKFKPRDEFDPEIFNRQFE